MTKQQPQPEKAEAAMTGLFLRALVTVSRNNREIYTLETGKPCFYMRIANVKPTVSISRPGWSPMTDWSRLMRQTKIR